MQLCLEERDFLMNWKKVAYASLGRRSGPGALRFGMDLIALHNSLSSMSLTIDSASLSFTRAVVCYQLEGCTVKVSFLPHIGVEVLDVGFANLFRWQRFILV